MKLGKIIGGTKRTMEVLASFTLLSFDYLREKNDLAGFSSLRGKNKETFPVRFRKKLEELGPSFVKIGQILSLRTEIIPPEISRELEKLFYSTKPFPGEQAKKIIEEEVKQPLDEIFLSISEKPIGSASLGQVHYGILKSGEEVAVKVMRPGISEVVEYDLFIFKLFARLIEKIMPQARDLNFKRAVQEIEVSLKRELDFSVEAENAQKIKENLLGMDEITVPKIYREYSTPKVLMMEYVEGVSLNNLDYQRLDPADKKRIVSVICNAILKQMFEDGFFHADPHPGNIFILKNRKLSLLDFGMVGKLNEFARKKMAMAFIELINNDPEEYSRHILALAELSEDSDVDEFISELKEITFKQTGSETISVAQKFFKTLTAGIRYGIYFPPDLTMFIKAIITFEGVAKKLDPDFILENEVEPLIENLISKLYNVKEFVNSLEQVGSKYLSFVDRLLILSMRILKASEEGILLNEQEIQIQPLQRQKKSEKNTEDNFNRWLILLFLTLGFSSILSPAGPQLIDFPVFPWLFFGAATMLIVRLCLR